jgi:hypothetical protein
MNRPVFSVLIPSIPRRQDIAMALWNKVTEQARSFDVEVLLLLDNKKRSIGKKREALVKISQGDYVAFVDDDDDVADGYVAAIVEASLHRPDVIVFDSSCSIDGAPPVTVRHGLEFENEQFNQAGFTRKPWHIHPWRGDIARSRPFPDVSYGEDWGWCETLLPDVKVQLKIDGLLYHYRYNKEVSEAFL